MSLQQRLKPIYLTKRLLFKYHPDSAAYDSLVIADSLCLINGIKHVIFEHKFISAN